MNEDDKKAFLEDFKKSDTSKKLDMWYYALEQEALWEEIIGEMSDPFFIGPGVNIGICG